MVIAHMTREDATFIRRGDAMWPLNFVSLAQGADAGGRVLMVMMPDLQGTTSYIWSVTW